MATDRSRVPRRGPGRGVGAEAAVPAVLAAVLVGLLLHLFGIAAHVQPAEPGRDYAASVAASAIANAAPPGDVPTIAFPEADGHEDGECSDFVRGPASSMTPLGTAVACAGQPAAIPARAVVPAPQDRLGTVVGPTSSPGVQRI